MRIVMEVRDLRNGDRALWLHASCPHIESARISCTRVAGSSSTQTSLTAGANLARSFIAEGPNGNLVTIVPSFGVNGFTNRGLFDPLVGLTGLEFEDDALGVLLNTGLEVRFANGAALGLGTTFVGVGSDEQNIKLLGGLAIPF